MNFNNTDLSNILEVLAVRGRGVVQYEVNSTTVARRNGALYRNKRRPPRPLEVDVAILGESQEDLRTKIDQLNGILAVDEDKAIVFPDEPDKTYYGMPEKSTEDDEFVSTNTSTLSFICHDPDKIGKKITEVDNSNLYVRCTAPVKPFITATITTATNFVKFALGTEILTLHFDFSVDDTIKIDCTKEVVYINGIEQNITIDILESDFFYFQPGENVLSVEPGMSYKIEYVERWL